MSLKIRPFKTTVEEIDVTGAIQENLFVVQFYGRPYPVSTLEVGRDERGPYALIEETNRRENFCDVFLVEPEYDEDFPPGCRIALFRDKANEVRALLVNQGIDPDPAILTGTASDAVSVYFDFDGNKNGYSLSGPPPLDANEYPM